MAPSTRVRVYVPLTPRALERARDDGGFGPAPLPGHAVTPALLEALGDQPDQEDAEYAAMTAAALESLRLLDPEEPAARVVAAVDVTAWTPRTGGAADPSAVSVAFTVPLKRLAAVLVDAADAADDVAAARDAFPGSDEDELPEAVERCLDHELGWYASQELDELVAALALG